MQSDIKPLPKFKMSFMQSYSEGGSFSSDNSLLPSDLTYHYNPRLVNSRDPLKDNLQVRRLTMEHRQTAVKKPDVFPTLNENTLSDSTFEELHRSNLLKHTKAKEAGTPDRRFQIPKKSAPVSAASSQLQASVNTRYLTRSPLEILENEGKPFALDSELKDAKIELEIYVRRLSDANDRVQTLEVENLRLKKDLIEARKTKEDLADKRRPTESLSRAKDPVEQKALYEKEAEILKLKAENASKGQEIQRLTGKITRLKDRDSADKNLALRLVDLEAKVEKVNLSMFTPLKTLPQQLAFKNPSNEIGCVICKETDHTKELPTPLLKVKPSRYPSAKLLGRRTKPTLQADSSAISFRNQKPKPSEVVGVYKQQLKPEKPKSGKKKRVASAKNWKG